ncbi:MAG: biotin--[acetyl-CoA-carboxylase] ligase [Rickettsiaceae bacterium]
MINSTWIDEYHLLIFNQIDSTNDEAKRLISNGLGNDDCVIIADQQISGRGRRGKEWISDIGNLYCTILLCGDIKVNQAQQLSFLSSIALYDAIVYLAQNRKITIDIKLKWPNDLLINGNKVSGILIESIKHNNQNYTLIGLGANLAKHPEIDQATTSLLKENISINNFDMLDLFMHSFAKYLSIWQFAGFDQIKSYWMQRSYKLDTMLIVNDNVNNIAGAFCGIDDEGNLLLRKSDDNNVMVFNSAQVSLLV